MEIKNRTTFAFAPIMGRVNFPSHTATLVVKAGFRLVPGGVCEPLEEQPGLEGDVLSKAGVPECLYDADLAHFKPKTDVLATGYAYAPGGKAVPTFTATFGVGGWSKSIACIGNRVWDKGLIRSKMGKPEPFTRVALTWANAFGGAKVAANPAGKGNKDGLLPNLEDPDNLIGGAGDKPRPTCFGPVHRTWKPRTKKMGTYDKKWQKERWPAFPEDFDWTHFNAASEDQQLEGFLRGDEEITLKNMHREHAEIKTKLPGLRVRVLLREGDDNSVREVPMNLDTLFVDAEKEEVYLTWRGIANVSDADWLECNDILIVQEKLGEQRDRTELLPLFDEEGEDEEIEEVEEAETPEQLQARLDAFYKEFDDAEAQALGYEKQLENSFNQKVRGEVKVDDIFSKARTASPVAFADGMKGAGSGMEQLLSVMAARNVDVPKRINPNDLKLMADPDVQEMMKLAESSKPPRPTEARQIVALAKSGEAGGGDFSGAELNKQDLSGADLSDTYLHDAQLEGANLSGANLKFASMVKANLKGADLSDADLTDADLTGADLTDANLNGAILEDTVLNEAVLAGASLKGVKAPGAMFIEVKADGVDFTAADLTEAVFSKARLGECNFSESTLTDAAFDEVAATGATFDNAAMTNFRGGGESDYTGASFKGVNAAGSVWENCNLTRTDFHKANLVEAQFPFADMTESRLLEANLAGSLLHKTILKGARAGEANFFKALLEQTDFTAASLVRSNFFEADFLEATTDDADFDGANLKMTKLAK